MAKAPLTFRIFQGGKLVREETLAHGVIKLGKVPSAHLRLDDESVSRMHAIIEVDAAGGIQLIDLGSTRGTFVNGAKINKAKLVSGDSILVGDTTIELTVAAAAATQTLPRPVAEPVAELVPTPAPAVTWAKPPRVIATPAPAPSAPAALPRATPTHSFLAAPAASPAQIAAVMVNDEPGAHAVEVAAMLGDSVVEVKHCMDPHGGRITRGTYALLGASLVCLATSAAAFVSGVGVASRNAEGLAYWTHVAHKPVQAFRGEHENGALEALAIGGLALGLAAAATGLGRSRRERRSPYFRIGTAAGVELATESAPSPSFPLVAPSGDDFVFNFGPGMDGEMIIGGASTPFAELVASGRAKPSMAVPGAHELAIPAAAKIRARAGATTFLVSAVAKPRAQAQAGLALDGRAAMYAAASLVAHFGLYSIAQLGSADAATIGIDLNAKEDLAIRTNTTDMETTPPPIEKTTGDTGGEKSSASGQMALPEGAAGTTKSTIEARMAVKQTSDLPPAMAREQAIAYARESGFLGDAPALTSAISSLSGTEAIANGFDTDNYNGALFGAAGEGAGHFGGGRTGWGGGGGCLGDECGGIGVGRYHTIGIGPGAGIGWGPGPGHGPGLRPRTSLLPTVSMPPPTAIGGLDKAIIKRYVGREHEKIQYCYTKELLAHPDLEGEIVVKFFIAPDGSVQAADGAGFNAEVASCVAGVVHRIAFPAPHDGGGVQVNYPFHFRMAAAK